MTENLGIESLQRPRRRMPLHFAALFALSAVCGAATYKAVLSIAHWRTEADDARIILASPRATLAEKENAAYVLLRNELANAEAAKQAAQDPGVAGQHARNLIEAARRAWSR